MYGVMIALASGALMSIQGVFNTGVAFVQFTALLVCLAAWLLYDRTSFWSLWEIQDKYVLLGGAIGALITATVIRSMNALGPAKAAMLIVIAQLAVAWMIELLGVFGVEKQEFSMRKLLGLLIAVAGVITFEL